MSITTCALCIERPADKSNTHYLTDAIIRSCLNLNGTNDREKGFYFDLSEISHVEFGFQRETNIETLEQELGRQPTDEEIEKAKRNPYSVDNVFCKSCENLFTKIEDHFIKDVLPNLRDSDLKSKKSLLVSDVRCIRLFFYIQIWRSAICVKQFSLSPDVMEKLRITILESSLTNSRVPHFPLSVTYLETLGGEMAFTSNLVAILRFENPFVIMMNDFIIQFYEDEDLIRHESIAGLNELRNYMKQINCNEDQFMVSILCDEGRKSFLAAFQREEAQPKIQHYTKSFVTLWQRLFGIVPSAKIVEGYLSALTKDGQENILNYTKATITKITIKYIKEHGPRNY